MTTWSPYSQEGNKKLFQFYNYLQTPHFITIHSKNTKLLTLFPGKSNFAPNMAYSDEHIENIVQEPYQFVTYMYII